MHSKALYLTAAVALAATGPNAATLSTVDPVVGGPTLTVSGSLIVEPETIVMAPPGSGLPPLVVPASAIFTNAPNPLSMNVILLNGGSFAAFSVADGSSLLGTLIETNDEAGLIHALFDTTGGSLTADFGDLFVLELTSTAIFDGILDATSAFTGDVDAIVYAVAETAVIPLPAGVWLLLGGLGTLVAIRRGQTV